MNATGAQVQNDRGEWVPAIPLPFYRGWPRRFQCQCGDRFLTRRRHREHYALAHILGLK